METKTLNEALGILRDLGKNSKQNRIAVPARKAVTFVERVVDGLSENTEPPAPEPEPKAEPKPKRVKKAKPEESTGE